MKVMLTQRNQITIPKNLINDLNLELGKYYELSYEDNRIILDISKNYDIDDNNFNKISSVSNASNNIKIVSNLDEGKSFSRQVYSDCKLVIRTKRSYLNKFCEVCQGQLAKENNIEHMCPYIIQEKPIQEKPIQIIDHIKSNVQTLNKNLDSKISKYNKEYL